MRYKIVLEYDGSAFHGWQRQPGCRTVQGEAESALSHICPGASVTASGRTDEGVHALAQPAHFDADPGLPPETMLRALNHWLPEDISVVGCSVAPDSFDARKSAKRKTYEYVMYTSPVPSPLRRTRECRIGDRADVAAMNAAASRFVGTHDFSAFMTSGSSAKRCCVFFQVMNLVDMRQIFALLRESAWFCPAGRICRQAKKIPRKKLTAGNFLLWLLSYFFCLSEA